MSAPRVYAAISAIMAELAETGIAKSRTNARDQYVYRSIDDVMARMSPLLAKHRLCILPRVIERSSEDRSDATQALLIRVALRVAFDLVSGRDGSLHTVEAFGEALDSGDKATSKAMSAAFKQAILQAFCVPISGYDDAEAASHRLVAKRDQPDPDQGWDQWAFDIQDMLSLCETIEAIDRVQTTYRRLFRAASVRRPDIYEAIGQVIKGRRDKLTQVSGNASPANGVVISTRRSNGKAAPGSTAHA
jgi:hypothetical protein